MDLQIFMKFPSARVPKACCKAPQKISNNSITIFLNLSILCFCENWVGTFMEINFLSYISNGVQIRINKLVLYYWKQASSENVFKIDFLM